MTKGQSFFEKFGFVNQGPHLIETVTGPADMLVTNQWMADRDVLHWKKNR